jgi:hypothetical protein
MKLYLLAVGIFVAFLVGISRIYLGGSLADGRSHRVVCGRGMGSWLLARCDLAAAPRCI